MAHKLSSEAQQVLDDFKIKNDEFQKAWEEFEQRHEKDLIILELLRESRNAALDAAVRTIRAEADSPDCKDKTLKAGPFAAMKKASSVFHADMLLARIHEADLFDQAKAVGAIEVTTTVKYKEMKQFLLDKKVYPDFEDCEDSINLTTAISGPKPIGPFGAEMKK